MIKMSSPLIWFDHYPGDSKRVLDHFCYEFEDSSLGWISEYCDEGIHFKVYDPESGEVIREDITVSYSYFFRNGENFIPISKAHLYERISKESPLGKMLVNYLYA
jgi:hypothetical protein